MPGRRTHSDVTVLHRVPYKVYARLTEVWENRFLKMAYTDGTLEIVSPNLFEHERASIRFNLIVTEVASALGFEYNGAGGATFRRGGSGKYQGVGKEPDESFYIASADRYPLNRNLDLDAGDPPPDLWVEIDNRFGTVRPMPIYSALGVPEVWRYRVRRKTLKFLRLGADGYESIDRSVALPGLSPDMVLDVLKSGEGIFDSVFNRQIRAWAQEKFGAPSGPG